MATVLLVEDNRDVANMLALALELEGHDVHVAYDGAAGLREAARIEPDIGVLDIGLPRLDGIELAHALRQMHGNGVTLIACTGIADGLPASRIANAGFDHVFLKPVSIDTLLDAVDDGLAQHGSAIPMRRRAVPGTGRRAARSLTRHTGA